MHLPLHAKMEMFSTPLSRSLAGRVVDEVERASSGEWRSGISGTGSGAESGAGSGAESVAGSGGRGGGGVGASELGFLSAFDTPKMPNPRKRSRRGHEDWLIGRGTSSCVYSPPLPCADETEFPHSTVSKYAGREDVEHEVEIYRVLDKIDPEYRHHFKVHGSCATHHELSCPGTTDPALLIMDRAQPRRVDESPEDLEANVHHLMRGFRLMADAGIQYNDLHADNVMVGEDGRWKVIDFGEATLTTPELARQNLETLAVEVQRSIIAHHPLGQVPPADLVLLS